MKKRLQLLNWTRICVWNMEQTDIRSAKKELTKAIPDKTKIAGTRRVLQWNGVIRHDFWTPRRDIMDLLNHITSKNNRWRAKEFQTIRERRPNLTHISKRSPKETFKILTLNSQGISSKYHELIEYIERISPDFAIIQETRQPQGRGPILSSNYDSVNIPEQPQMDSARGLMIMYCRDTYTVTKLNTDKEVEHWILPVLAKHKSRSTSHLIVGVYLNANRQIRDRHIKPLIRTILKLRKEHGETPITVAGDWNMRTPKVDSLLNQYHQIGLQRHGEWGGDDYTWRSTSNGVITKRTLIDHILTEPRDTAPSVRIDYSYGRSDHHPVIATWDLPQQQQNNASQPVTRMSHKLILAKSDAIRNTNYFAPLLTLVDNEGPEELAEKLAEACWKAAEETGCTSTTTPGSKRKKRKHRTSNASKRLLRRRNKETLEWIAHPTKENYEKLKNTNKETRKSLKNDAATRIANYQMKLGDSIATGEASDEAWRLINACIGRASSRTEIRALENIATQETATTEEGIGEALFQHYKLLFSDNENFNTIDWDSIPIHTEESELPGINAPIEWPELAECIKKLGKNKSPGPDGVVSEMYITATRSDCPKLKEKVKTEPICDLGRTLLGLTRLIWRTGKFPRCWDAAAIISLPKKPGSTKPGDYRGISLIQTASKLMTSLLASRILNGALKAGRLCKEQAGFRSYEEAVAQATLVYDLAQRARAQWKTTFITFIDAEKAFDRAPHGAIVAKARAFGVRGMALELIKNLYQNPSFTVRNGAWTSQPGKVEKGVKQGDPLSPILFSIFMNDLNKAIQVDAPSAGHALYPGGPQITAGKFADDVAMIAPDKATAIHQQLKASNWMDLWKMRANAAKCAVMAIEPVFPGYTPLDLETNDWKLQGQSIPVKHEYTYLGVHLNSALDLQRTAAFRLDKAKNVKNMCLKFFWSKSIPLHIKTVVLKHIIVPVITYGCEVWGWNDKASKEADDLITECIRNIVSGSKQSNKKLLRHTIEVDSLRDMAILKSIRLFKKSTKSMTHFHDIVRDLDPTIRCWGTRTIEEIFQLQHDIILSDKLEFQIPPALQDIDSPKFMEFIKSQIRRRSLKQDLEKQPNEAESTERFREGASIKWNRTYLLLWKLHPTISKGFTILLKIRVTDFRGTYRLAREGRGPHEWLTTCPFCKSINHPEYAEHMIMICTAWTRQRLAIFNSTALVSARQVLLTSMTTGQAIFHTLTRIMPTAVKKDHIEPALLKTKQAIEAALAEIDLEEELPRWIIKTATFLENINFKRRKMIDRMQVNDEHQTPQKTTKQLRITDFWKRS